MKVPTLDEYIAAYPSRVFPPNLDVRERGFRRMYVRMTRRWIAEKWHDPTLDVAAIEATRPGHGTFTALIHRLRRTYQNLTIYVECVHNVEFRGKLTRLGFLDMGLDCFVLLPRDETNR